jgi:hypothetical protein
MAHEELGTFYEQGVRQGKSGCDPWPVRLDRVPQPTFCATTATPITIGTTAGSVFIPFLWHPASVSKRYYLQTVELSMCGGAGGSLGFYIQAMTTLPAIPVTGFIQPYDLDAPTTGARFGHVVAKPTGTVPCYGGRNFTNAETNNYYRWDASEFPRGAAPSLRPNRDEGWMFWLENNVALTTAPICLAFVTWTEE